MRLLIISSVLHSTSSAQVLEVPGGSGMSAKCSNKTASKPMHGPVWKCFALKDASPTPYWVD